MPESGYWRCPLCGAKNGDHAIGCWVTDDSFLEWIETGDNGDPTEAIE